MTGRWRDRGAAAVVGALGASPAAACPACFAAADGRVLDMYLLSAALLSLLPLCIVTAIAWWWHRAGETRS